MRLRLILALVILTVTGSTAAQAGPIIVGSITGMVETSRPGAEIGDTTNHVTLWWSLNTTDFGWFYGSNYAEADGTDVAYAAGVTDITQITDASAFAFKKTFIGPLGDANARGGIGDFLVLRNSTDHYGVARIDDISSGGTWVATLDATWWFRTDGGADFSGAASVPDPGSTLLLLGISLAGLGVWRKRRQ